MTCVRAKIAGQACILTFADDSEPFLCAGHWYVVNKQFGPIATDKEGEPLDRQPSGRKLQAAFDHYERMRLRKA